MNATSLWRALETAKWTELTIKTRYSTPTVYDTVAGRIKFSWLCSRTYVVNSNFRKCADISLIALLKEY